MINPAPPVHKPGKFIETGAWMDGWESKRHNPTYDWCIIQLGFPGSLKGFDLDTHYFTGNQAPFASVDAAYLPQDSSVDEAHWVQLLPRVALHPDSHNIFELTDESEVYTHLRVNNIPDGGIARFRAYGNLFPVYPEDKDEELDLAFVGHGGKVVQVSDQHYTPASNILLPGRGKNMGDGWETRRSREPGHKDHVVIQLGQPGYLTKAVIDTCHYRGNYPHQISLEGALSSEEIPTQWTTLVPPSSVGPHDLFSFDLDPTHVYSHVKFSIIPDGGVQRVRIYGRCQ
ncbi:allantoicase [Pilobolus umbonatus]|nr:allantoicase [Pilobolus umbonatus]